MADLVEIILALKNVRQFVAGADQASGAMGKVGDTSEKAGKQAGIGWKGVAKWAGGAAAIYGATKFVKGAVSATEDLAKSTITLQRTTGLDTQTASEWAALTKERGIATKQFQVGLVKLSKTMETARTGTAKQATTIAGLRQQIDDVAAAGGKKAPAQIDKLSKAIVRAQQAGEKSRATLAQLGVPLSELQKGDTGDVLNHVADAMQKMTNPAQRAALAQQLFGRSGQALVPILMKGSQGVQELLDEQKRAGNYISGKGINDTKKLVQEQRALETSISGLKVQMGQALLPVMVSVGKILVRLAQFVRPITSNATALKLVLAGVTAALIALKVATIAAAAAEGEITMATKLWTAAQWLLNAAMEGNPIVLVTTAIIALGVALFIAYKKVGWFHDAVDATFHAIVRAGQWLYGWFKANWPLLVGILGGPFALAAVLIFKHFGQIKQYVSGAVDAVKQTINGLVSWVSSVPGKITAAFKTAFDDLVHYIESIPAKIGGVAKHIPGYGIAKKVLGFMAAGGYVAQTGPYVVGERGPEVVSIPRGAVVQPIVAQAAVAGRSGGGPLEITIPVMLDGREIARSTARVTADRLARR